MCPPAACTWLMQFEYAECGGCHFEIVVPEIAHWTSPTVCGSSVSIAPSPKVIPGPTPLALSFRSPSGSTATCQPFVLPPNEQARVALRALADRNSPTEHVRLAGQDEDLLPGSRGRTRPTRRTQKRPRAGQEEAG